MENKVSQFVSIDEKKGTTDNPLVSIIIPVLNGVKYLEICLQSVLSQSYPYIELIFVDGCSTDDTLDVLASYKAKYPNRIRFISEPDKGSADAWNKGLKMARGDILGSFGVDDMLEPDAIMTVVEFFKSNPDACFVFGGCNVMDEKGEIIRELPTKDFDLKEAINDQCYIHTPSAFYKREVIEKVGLIRNIPDADLDYWIRVGKVFQLYRVEKILANGRMYKNSVSYRLGPKEAARADFILARQHGGSIFSPRALRYCIYVIRSPIEPFVEKVLKRSPFIKKVLKAVLNKAFDYLREHCS